MEEQNIDQYFNQQLLFKIQTDDLININDICTNKCIKSYDNYNLTNTERVCLENCFFKNFEIEKFILDEFKHVIEKLD